ncbi:hypothetical protein H0H87_004847 [Tephrocybe sp. NHM501043]|nr:hypothetical protein H0H87_004847 [Tephrocybe sp. NHM501043]
MTAEQVQEEKSVGILANMMGVDNDQARRVLRKHNGNVEKAVDAMLLGDNGDDEPPPLWPLSESSQDPGYIDPAQLTGQHPSSSEVIDLTKDDTDSTRTMKLGQAQDDTKFGPSERPSDPTWQMVTTNKQVDTNQEDQAMNEAIQASLAEFGPSDELEMFPMEESVREGGRPVALRTDASEIAYAALIIQALAQIPQVRHRIATLADPIDGSPRSELCLQIVELFSNLDLAQLSAIVDKEVLPCMRPPPWNGSYASLGDASKDFLRNFAQGVDNQLNIQYAQEDPSVRLFQFLHAKAESRGSSTRFLRHTRTTGNVVGINTADPSATNDLISHLSHNLTQYDEITRTTSHDVIVEPSELLVFNIQRTTSGSGKSTAEPFTFPKQFYLDRFIYENIQITQQKRVEEREMQHEISELVKKKKFLTDNEGRDVLTDLRISLHYFQEVAHSDKPERQTSIERTAMKLRGLLDSIVSAVRDIDAEIERLQAAVASVYDIPELQKNLYVLRSVFMHTGLPGRKQIYSYIQDAQEVWWKTMDHIVTEVPEETALMDSTGLHLGAGPYLLIYSQHLPDEVMRAPVAWPQALVEGLQLMNEKFLSYLPPDAVAKAGVPIAQDISNVSMSSFSPNPSKGQEKTTEIGVNGVQSQSQAQLIE